MLRLSQALLGAELDPQRAADALDAATGLAANGFERLAARPGSRAGPARVAPPAGAAPPLTLTGSAREQQAAPPAGGSQRSGAPGSPSPAAAASALGGGGEEVDSLVANARAAAQRAESALADLASPPRLPAAAGSGSAPRPRAPQSHGEQRQARSTAAASGEERGQARAPAELQLAAADGGGPGAQQLAPSVALLPADAEALAAHLRRHSEALIRWAALGAGHGGGLVSY